jgi:hypothetical protein
MSSIAMILSFKKGKNKGKKNLHWVGEALEVGTDGSDKDAASNVEPRNEHKQAVGGLVGEQPLGEGALGNDLALLGGEAGGEGCGAVGDGLEVPVLKRLFNPHQRPGGKVLLVDTDDEPDGEKQKKNKIKKMRTRFPHISHSLCVRCVSWKTEV